MAADISLSLRFRGGRRFQDAARGMRFFAQRFGVAIRDLDTLVERELRDMLDTVVAALRLRHSTQGGQGDSRLPVGERRGRLYRRKGNMLREIQQSVTVTGRGLDAIKGSISGPAVHEFGATIRPTRSQYLAIPLDAAKDSTGTPLPMSPRQFRDTFVARSKRGNLLIFQKRGGRFGRIVPLFALKKQVKVPARLGLGATLDKASDAFVDRVVEQAVLRIQGALDG